MKITIEQNPSNEFSRGKLVCLKEDSTFILLVTDDVDEVTFSGVRVSKWKEQPFGEHVANGWDKGMFMQFYGKITLEN